MMVVSLELCVDNTWPKTLVLYVIPLQTVESFIRSLECFSMEYHYNFPFTGTKSIKPFPA